MNSTQRIATSEFEQKKTHSVWICMSSKLGHNTLPFFCHFYFNDVKWENELKRSTRVLFSSFLFLLFFLSLVWTENFEWYHFILPLLFPPYKKVVAAKSSKSIHLLVYACFGGHSDVQTHTWSFWFVNNMFFLPAAIENKKKWHRDFEWLLRLSLSNFWFSHARNSQISRAHYCRSRHFCDKSVSKDVGCSPMRMMICAKSMRPKKRNFWQQRK